MQKIDVKFILKIYFTKKTMNAQYTYISFNM